MNDSAIKPVSIDAHTRVCGLIGYPTGHSLSPLIHNTLASRCGQNLVYTAFDVNPGSVADAVRGAYELGFLGLNVTVPHKIEVMDSLCDIDPVARQIGAVNTLVRTEQGYKGYNTDIYGLERALLSEGVELEGRTVVILGAGGAARTCAFLCAVRKAGKVYILNRSVKRAEDLAADVNGYAGGSLCTPLPITDHDKITEKDIIVLQATSKGLYPDVEGVAVEDEAFYNGIGFGFDLIYKPYDTRFMQLVRKAGGRCANGLKMLLYQGVAAFELWNDITVPESVNDGVYSILSEAAYS